MCLVSGGLEALDPSLRWDDELNAQTILNRLRCILPKSVMVPDQAAKFRMKLAWQAECVPHRCQNCKTTATQLWLYFPNYHGTELLP